MPRRKEPRIPDAILDQLLAGADPKTAFDPNGLLDGLKKAFAERALNAEMDHHLAGVGAPALLRREPAPGGPERLVLGPRLQLQVAGAVLGARAQGPRRAGAAVGRTEHHRDVGRAGVLDLRAPGRRQLPLRAADPLPAPVDPEAVDRVAALDLALPARVP